VPARDDRLEPALEIAYAYLNRRERTQAEVRDRLGREQIPAAKIEAALEALIEQGYLDDARYARVFTEDRRELDGWGSDRIQRTLLQRGIDHEVIEDALRATETQSPESELDRALALLRRRFPDPPGNRRERDRALGVVLRKGYDSELALEALTAYTRDAGDPRDHGS
jgi:regulatory protein